MQQGTPNGPAVRLSRGNPTRGLTESPRSEKGRQQHGESCEAVRLPRSKFESGDQLRLIIRLGKRVRQCASRSAPGSPGEMSGAWPAYRKLQRGRSRGGAGNRVREGVLDSRAKPAGVRNDHRRRRSGNASCDQLKKRPPVGDPRKLYRFSSRGCKVIRFTVARRRGRTPGKAASSVQFTELHGDAVAGGASRRSDVIFKDECEVEDLDVAETAQVDFAVKGLTRQRRQVRRSEVR
jgi:hypothetical protein